MAPEEVIQEFPCSEPGCDQKVRYKEEVVIALSKKEKVVYLTCPKGRTNPYSVED